jgi:hypothetical protein
LLAAEFPRRRHFCAGISETWENDSGALFDHDAGTWLVLNGVAQANNAPQGKWGTGFFLPPEACQLWKSLESSHGRSVRAWRPCALSSRMKTASRGDCASFMVMLCNRIRAPRAVMNVVASWTKAFTSESQVALLCLRPTQAALWV